MHIIYIDQETIGYLNTNIFIHTFCISLQVRGFQYTGTIRQNRLQNTGLKEERELKKEKRGAMDSKIDSNTDIAIVRWYDNTKVDLISSLSAVDPIENTKRYDKKQKKIVEVPCPNVVKTYNANMGGVDLLDCLTALYKAKIKTRRWYIYILYHTINMAVVTSWLL